MTQGRKRYAAGQILGARERQEDEYGIQDFGEAPGGRLVLALADGMGGYAGGAEAAHCVIERFFDALDAAARPLAEALLPAMSCANQALAKMKNAQRGLADCGCTLVAAAIEADRLNWISVGDSSLLLVRGGVVQRLNADHSMRPVLADLVAAGRMSEADAKTNPNRNALRSVLAGDEPDLVDAPGPAVGLCPGDVVLLASDGLETLDYGQIGGVLQRPAAQTAEEIARDLLAAVESFGKPRQDNTTVIVYRHGGGDKMSKPPEPLKRPGRLRYWVWAVVLLLALLAGVAWRLWGKTVIRPWIVSHYSVAAENPTVAAGKGKHPAVAAVKPEPQKRKQKGK